MERGYSWQEKVRFYTSMSLLYIVTIGGVWYLLQPISVRTTAYAAPAQSVDPTVTKELPQKPVAAKLVAGKPVRLIISGSGIDLPIDEGFYNEQDNSWTLSDIHAQYAMMTTVANNLSGNTFIYGHGTDAVLGALGAAAPVQGSTALIYTDNGHVLAYSYQDKKDFGPDDTSVFDYTGPSMLTIQTCTGSVSEWRSMYQFSFDKVVS